MGGSSLLRVQLVLAMVPGGSSVTPTLYSATYGSGRTIQGYTSASESSPSPLYVYLAGSFETIHTTAAMDMARAMADRGYVTATVAYPNSAYEGTCSVFNNKASDIFGTSGATSVLCARPDVDCSMGIAVHGFSQGAHLASLAAAYETRITAALLFGNGNSVANGWIDTILGRRLGSTEGAVGGAVSSGLGAIDSILDGDTGGDSFTFGSGLACLNNASVSLHLPSNKRRSVSGNKDEAFGVSQTHVLGQLKETTGYDCGESTDCLQPDGSGYFVVTTPDANTDHAFFQTSSAILETNFETENVAWGLKASFDWLAAAALLPPSPSPPTSPPGAPPPVIESSSGEYSSGDSAYEDTLPPKVAFLAVDPGGRIKVEPGGLLKLGGEPPVR